MNKEKIDYEKMLLFLKSAPANIFFKDTECRYRFLTEVCDHVHGEGIGNSIIGKTDLEIHEDTHSGQMYYKDDLKILKTGQGSHFVSAYKTAIGTRYYDIKKNPVFCNGEVIGIMGIIDDVTQQKEIPENYIPIRLGGDEFLIICPNTSSAMSEEIIEQLNEQLKVKSDDILKLSVSWGHSTVEDDTMSMEDVVRKADKAMYHQKLEFHKNRKK